MQRNILHVAIYADSNPMSDMYVSIQPQIVSLPIYHAAMMHVEENFVLSYCKVHMHKVTKHPNYGPEKSWSGFLLISTSISL